MIKAKRVRPELYELCRVIQSDGELGPTLYIVDAIGQRGRCFVREAGNPLSAGQEFDLSLLQKVSRD
jgi:hypothetical protein